MIGSNRMSFGGRGFFAKERGATNHLAGPTARPKPAQLIAALVFALSLFAAINAAPRAADPAIALRERFLDAAGLPSETVYATSHGILPAPGSETFNWKVVFKLSYKTADLARLKDVQPLHTDCYFIRTRKYTAQNRAEPVWDGRVFHAGQKLRVATFTSKGERVFGHIDQHSRVVRSKDADLSVNLPDLAGVEYNPFTGQLWRRAPGSAIEEQQRFYLPLTLVNSRGEPTRLQFELRATGPGEFELFGHFAEGRITLASCSLAHADMKRSAGYRPRLGLQATMPTDEDTTVFEIPGEIAGDVLDVHGSAIVLRQDVASPVYERKDIGIDGRFEDWRNVRGIADPERDIVSYLQHNADTDLLEFKVTSDAKNLYFYTRVAGRHGNTGPPRDRYYFYVYIDADRDPTTGYVPTREDDCYYGVALGDDCEAQFEFIGGRFVKTFFGFAGRSTEKDILAGRATIGPSWYAKHDEQGRLRDGYKVEYINRAGRISITEDFKEGTSDDIQIALSPDGSECEMRASLSGFLRDANGKPTIAPGQRIDLAAGVEASGQIHGHRKWGADSTAIVRDYEIGK
jgi:hypothetical protein